MSLLNGPGTSNAAAQPPRPPNWRAPSRGEYVCTPCGGAACFGDGNAAYCTSCVPESFFRFARGGHR